MASPSFAFWFIALTLVTFFATLGALAQSLGVFATLGVLTAGSAVTAAGLYAGSLATIRAGGVPGSLEPNGPGFVLTSAVTPLVIPA